MSDGLWRGLNLPLPNLLEEEDWQPIYGVAAVPEAFGVSTSEARSVDPPVLNPNGSLAEPRCSHFMIKTLLLDSNLPAEYFVCRQTDEHIESLSRCDNLTQVPISDSFFVPNSPCTAFEGNGVLIDTSCGLLHVATQDAQRLRSLPHSLTSVLRPTASRV